MAGYPPAGVCPGYHTIPGSVGRCCITPGKVVRFEVYGSTMRTPWLLLLLRLPTAPGHQRGKWRGWSRV